MIPPRRINRNFPHLDSVPAVYSFCFCQYYLLVSQNMTKSTFQIQNCRIFKWPYLSQKVSMNLVLERIFKLLSRLVVCAHFQGLETNIYFYQLIDINIVAQVHSTSTWISESLSSYEGVSLGRPLENLKLS